MESSSRSSSAGSSAKPLPSLWRILLIVMLLLGVFFRLVYLDGKVFWVDEAFTALRVSGYTETEVVQAWAEEPLTTVAALQRYQFPLGDRPLSGTIGGLAASEPQLPPLYFVLTRWWVQLWGDSIAVMRSLGAIASLATLPLLALLCRELFPTRVTAYLAVCLMAVSPFQVIYAQEARPYSLWTLLTVAASWALLRALRRRRWGDWVVYGLMLTLALYTFVYTVFVMLAHAAYGLWERRSAPLSPPILRPILVSQAAAIVAFLPWLGAIARNWQQGLQLASWQRQPLPQRFLALPLAWMTHISRTFLDFDPTFGYDLSRLFPYLLAVLAILVGVIYSLYRLWKTAPPSASRFILLLLVIPALGVIVPDLLTGGQQSTVSRYFVPCWVALGLAIAHTLASWLPQRLAAISLAGLLTLGVLSCGTSAAALSWWNKEGGYIPYVAYPINQTANPLIISTSDWWLFSLAHTLRPETALQIITQLDQVPAIPAGYSHYFLYSAPPILRDALQQQGFQLTPFDQLDQVPLLCLTPPGTPPQPCPPTPN